MRICDWSSDVCSSDLDDPEAGDLYEVGTLAQVLQLLKLPDGTIKVLVEGVSRARVDDVGERDGCLAGRGVVVESTATRDPREVEAVARSLMSLFEQYVKTNRKLPPELLQRSEEHTSELQSLMRNSYAVFCLKKKNTIVTLMS